MTFRARLVLTVAAAAAFGAIAAVAAAPANALLGISLGGNNCPTTGAQIFQPIDGDTAQYYLAPNGGLESGSTGWSLSGGASVVGGNEPFLRTGTHSLSLPSGSTATSPVTCIGPKNDYIRMFASDAGGTDSGLRVRIIWYGLLNIVQGITDFRTLAPGGPWAPSAKVDSGGGGNIIIPLLGSTSARIQVTPIGSGSKWVIDDVFVDPCFSL